MVVWKERHSKFKSSSKTDIKSSTKPKTSMELKEKESKSPRLSTSAKNKPKPLQFKPASYASKCLKAVIEESTKGKTHSLMDKNSGSSKRGEEQVEFGESESNHSSKSKASNKDKKKNLKGDHFYFCQKQGSNISFNSTNYRREQQKRKLLRISPLMKKKKRMMSKVRKKRMTVKRNLSKLKLRNQLS